MSPIVRGGLYFICCCSLHAHLKGIGMKFVVYRHAKESELSDELLMVSQSVVITCPVAMETSIHLCRLVNQSCCTI